MSLDIQGTTSAVSYSYEEQFTGSFWVDGRKIYRRTFDFGPLLNAAKKQVEHGIVNLGLVITASGVSIDDFGNVIPLPYAHGTGSVGLFTEDKKFISVHPESDRSAFHTTWITLEYTCTDR